jgi:hypothetical protein
MLPTFPVFGSRLRSRGSLPVLRGLLSIAVMAELTLCHAQGILSTVAGNGSIGTSGDGGAATSAAIGFPAGVAVDATGNIYIADSVHSVVRKVNTSGIISTFAGTGSPLFTGAGGPATSVGIAFLPASHTGLAVDTAGTMTTVAGNGTSNGLGGFSGDGGPATSAQLNTPRGVAVDGKGNLYIADSGNGRIRMVDTKGIITTIAGIGPGSDAGDGGPATAAQLSIVSDVVVDSSSNLYLAEGAHVRQILPTGIINTVAHGFFGTCQQAPVPAANADVGTATGLAVDAAGNLFIADESAGCVQKLDTSGKVTTVAGGGTSLPGDGGPATSAGFGSVYDVAVDAAGNIYITDSSHSLIRKVGASATVPSISPKWSGERRQFPSGCRVQFLGYDSRLGFFHRYGRLE